MASGIGAPTLGVALLALPAAHTADFKVLFPRASSAHCKRALQATALSRAREEAAMSAEVDLFESRQVSGKQEICS